MTDDPLNDNPLSDDPLRALARFGQSPWLDFIDRNLIESGELERMIAEWGLRGITSNPAIFEKAIAHTDGYDADIARLKRRGHDVTSIYESLAIADVRTAADLFRGVYEETDGLDGLVSFEVSPHLARDARRTVSEARRLWAALDRPNVMIKVPGTSEGLTAVTTLLADGININVTLLFSVERYEEVLHAHAAGLRQALDAGRRIERIASVASFFLSRIDTAVDHELERLAAGRDERGAAASLALRGTAAIASARCAYGRFEAFCRSDAFAQIAARGARRQRLLWASTGAKDPSYSEIKYVEPLVGAHTVNTMPRATLESYRLQGRPSRRLPDDVARGPSELETLRRAGIDLDAVTHGLLEAGIAKFTEPYDALLLAIERRGGHAS